MLMFTDNGVVRSTRLVATPPARHTHTATASAIMLDADADADAPFFRYVLLPCRALLLFRCAASLRYDADFFRCFRAAATRHTPLRVSWLFRYAAMPLR